MEKDTSIKADAILIVIKNLETRMEKLEEAGKKHFLKRITDNAGAVALFLGLILTLATLYDVLVTKREADRVNSISQFNKAVSSAAQIRQELLQMQAQMKDPGSQLQILSMATPRILNDVHTARAILRDLKDSDVGIPQLIILISESFNAGDPSAIDFVKRAVGKTDAPPYMRSEAKRYEGKYMFATGSPNEGRKAFMEALDLIPKTAYSNPSRAYDMVDWIGLEYMYGDCTVVETTMKQLGEILQSPGIAVDQRRQLTSSLAMQLQQYQGQHCPLPRDMSILKNP